MRGWLCALDWLMICISEKIQEKPTRKPLPMVSQSMEKGHVKRKTWRSGEGKVNRWSGL